MWDHFPSCISRIQKAPEADINPLLVNNDIYNSPEKKFVFGIQLDKCFLTRSCWIVLGNKEGTILMLGNREAACTIQMYCLKISHKAEPQRWTPFRRKGWIDHYVRDLMLCMFKHPKGTLFLILYLCSLTCWALFFWMRCVGKEPPCFSFQWFCHRRLGYFCSWEQTIII